MKYQWDLFIFDFDGVIVNSGEDIVDAIQYTLALLNQPEQTSSQILAHIGHGVERMIRNVFAGVDEETIVAAIKIYRQYYLAHAVIKTRLYGQVGETLAVIKHDLHKKTAIVTSKPEELTRTILIGLKVSEYFDLVIGPESVKYMKPDPEGINKVLDYFGMAGNQAVMVGDMHTDIEAGKGAGVYTCGVTYGYGDQQELMASAPDLMIQGMGELLSHIE
ncbi:MAG: HAD family hydrolase [Methylocystaceae bacterium]